MTVRSRRSAQRVGRGRPQPGTQTRPAQARRSHDEQVTRSGTTRMFATMVPGLAPIVSRALAELPGITVQDSGFDGRSDLIIFEATRGNRRLAPILST